MSHRFGNPEIVNEFEVGEPVIFHLAKISPSDPSSS